MTPMTQHVVEATAALAQSTPYADGMKRMQTSVIRMSVYAIVSIATGRRLVIASHCMPTGDQTVTPKS